MSVAAQSLSPPAEPGHAARGWWPGAAARASGIAALAIAGIFMLERILLVSGDRESEVRYLADRVGIEEVYAGQTPEQKAAITLAETERAPTLFIGDGINDTRRS
jgi:P-type E1-E2 ATPase